MIIFPMAFTHRRILQEAVVLSNKLINSSFTGDLNGWGSGTDNVNGEYLSNNIVVYTNAVPDWYTGQTVHTFIGRTYLVSYDVISLNGPAGIQAGCYPVETGDNRRNGPFVAAGGASQTTATSPGTYTYTFVATSLLTDIVLASEVQSGYVVFDNVTCTPVVTPELQRSNLLLNANFANGTLEEWHQYLDRTTVLNGSGHAVLNATTVNSGIGQMVYLRKGEKYTVAYDYVQAATSPGGLDIVFYTEEYGGAAEQDILVNDQSIGRRKTINFTYTGETGLRSAMFVSNTSVGGNNIIDNLYLAMDSGVEGGNLLKNSGFNSDLSGWTIFGSGESWVADKARMTGGVQFHQTITNAIPGRTYCLRCEVTQVSGSSGAYVEVRSDTGTGGGGPGSIFGETNIPTGFHEYYFIAETNIIQVQLEQMSGGDTIDWDNVQLSEIVPSNMPIIETLDTTLGVLEDVSIGTASLSNTGTSAQFVYSSGGNEPQASTWFDTEIGETYQVSYSVRKNSGSGVSQMTSRIFPTKILTQTEKVAAVGSQLTLIDAFGSDYDAVFSTGVSSYTFVATSPVTSITMQIGGDFGDWEIENFYITKVGGSNLVSNGTFDANRTSWTNYAGGTVNWSSSFGGSLYCYDNVGGGGDGYAYQAVSLEVGQKYQLLADLHGGTTGYIAVATATNGGGAVISEVVSARDHVSKEFTATASTMYVILGVLAFTHDAYWDNIQIRKIS